MFNLVFSYCSVFILISSFFHSVNLIVWISILVFCIFSLILLTWLLRESVVITSMRLILISFVLIEALIIVVFVILQLVVIAVIYSLTRSSVISVIRLVRISLCLRMSIILSIIIIVRIPLVVSLWGPLSTVLEWFRSLVGLIWPRRVRIILVLRVFVIRICISVVFVV